MTKLVIVGGVAGGASAAARARRLDENLQITVFERGKYISYANCGLPYHLSGTIPGRDSLLLMTPELFNERFNVKIHTRHLVTAVNPHEHTVSVKNLATGDEFTESYDKLILSPGSSPLIPPIPGVDDRDVHVLWTIPDMDSIKGRIKPGVRAVVVGGGFIGVEVAENLTEAGVKTTMVEMQTTILPPLDHEMTSPVEKALVNGGVSLRTATSVTAFTRKPSGLEVTLSSGEILQADFVVMSVGVKPNSELARGTDIEVTDRGYFVVNERMETTAPDIYAVGDAVQVLDPLTGNKVSIPLAGPANKQGRIAAENALGGSSVYKGTIGTSILKIFDLAAGSTGANERTLKAAGIDYRKLYINPVNHAAYYPGGSKMAIKVLFSPEGAIFGAQVIGYEGVDKRLDIFATAIRHGLTVHHLEELELAYAPPFGSAKDAVNFAGFVAVNMINGLTDPVHPDEIPKDCFLLDVREEEETILGKIDSSTLIPLGELRRRLNELPKNRLIVVYCAVGIRGYAAERILKQRGYTARNLSGGFSIWKMYQDIGQFSEAMDVPENAAPVSMSAACEPCKMIDATGLQCPGPIVQVTRGIAGLKASQTMQVKATDRGFATDLPAWCRSTGNELVSMAEEKGIFNAVVKKGSGIITPAASPLHKNTAIVLFSNDFDKAMASMIMATGYATLGHKVTVFATFWGLSVFRKKPSASVKKDFFSKVMGIMLPGSASRLALSKMNMMGAGTAMMKHMMKKKNVDSIPELIAQAREMGVRFVACEMSMGIMGITRDEMMEGMEFAGVADFAAASENSDATLFI